MFRPFLLLFEDGENNDCLGFKGSIERTETGEKSIDINRFKWLLAIIEVLTKPKSKDTTRIQVTDLSLVVVGIVFGV